MKKKWIITAIIVMLCFSGCSGKSAATAKAETTLPTVIQTEPTEKVVQEPEARDIDFYSGTWTVTGIQANGVDFTVEQAAAMGAEQLTQVRLILTSDGIVCLYTDGDNVTEHWTVTEDGIQAGALSMSYQDGRLTITSNDDLLYFEKQSDDQTLPEAAVPSSEPEETTEPETTEPETEPEAAAPSGIRPEFKEAMDSYEAFYDQYCDFMKEYTKNPTDLSLLGKYAGMLSKVEEMDKKFEAWDESEMSNEELKYYLDVTARVQKRVIDLF